MLNRAQLVEIARLAKISLPAEDADVMLAEMGDLISIAQSVCDADLTGYDCTADIETSDMREDVVIPSTPADVLLSTAADSRQGYFCGPR